MPPHRVTQPEHRDALAADIQTRGWVGPALVGYPTSEGIQLLSGTHRRAAAELLGITVPVVVVPAVAVDDSRGHLDRWQALMRSGEALAHG